MKKKRRRQRAAANLGLCPTPERHRHDVIEEFARPIADDEGRLSRPWRSIDVLAAMERRDAITPLMRDAGEAFRAEFRQALLDPLRAASIEFSRGRGVSPPGGMGPNGVRGSLARAKVNSAKRLTRGRGARGLRRTQSVVMASRAALLTLC